MQSEKGLQDGIDMNEVFRDNIIHMGDRVHVYSDGLVEKCEPGGFALDPIGFVVDMNYEVEHQNSFDEIHKRKIVVKTDLKSYETMEIKGRTPEGSIYFIKRYIEAIQPNFPEDAFFTTVGKEAIAGVAVRCQTVICRKDMDGFEKDVPYFALAKGDGFYVVENMFGDCKVVSDCDFHVGGGYLDVNTIERDELWKVGRWRKVS